MDKEALSGDELFEFELQGRIARISTSEYRASAPEYEPLGRLDWVLLAAMGLLAPVVITVLALVTW